MNAAHHVVADGAEGVGPTHVHGGLVQRVQGLDVVPAFHLHTEDTVSTHTHTRTHATGLNRSRSVFVRW